MATAEQLKALLRSHASGDLEQFRAIAMQIAAHSARKGNSQLAEELRDLIDKTRRGHELRLPPTGNSAKVLVRVELSSKPPSFCGDWPRIG